MYVSEDGVVWYCGNSYTWAHDVRLHIAGTNEPKKCLTSKARSVI